MMLNPLMKNLRIGFIVAKSMYYESDISFSLIFFS
jgi:hypothetical protein